MLDDPVEMTLPRAGKMEEITLHIGFEANGRVTLGQTYRCCGKIQPCHRSPLGGKAADIVSQAGTGNQHRAPDRMTGEKIDQGRSGGTLLPGSIPSAVTGLPVNGVDGMGQGARAISV